MPAKKGFTQYCDKCNKNIGTYAFKRHYNICSTPKINKNQISNLFNPTPCPYCFKIYTSSSSFKNHSRRCIKNENRIIEKRTIDGMERTRIGSSMKNSGRKHLNIHGKMGGYRKNAGRSKKVKVLDSLLNEVTLQSSYELKCSILLNKLGIRWIRPNFIFYDNKKYFPDFLLIDYEIYLDPKNKYKAKIDLEKIEKVKVQNNIKLYVLLIEEINEEHIIKIINGQVA